MRPLTHFILGTFFALVLLVLLPKINLIGAVIICLLSVLIDVDHYLYYAYKKRDLSLKNAHNYFVIKGKKINDLPKNQRKNFYTGFYFLHGIEILIILFFLSRISTYFLYVLIGFAFHLVLDISYCIVLRRRVERFSIIYDFIIHKKLKLICD
ncbi:MAG: hypothetical protein KKF68_01460 [Nanoarchaeota archaeon]|nr:hypothetical protein [Nanoarchaeota archaeon]